jgi:cysteine desulfurase
MTVNNEIGSLQPIREIAKAIRYFRTKFRQEDSPFNFQDFNYPIFHTDASQAFLFEELNVEKLGVDLMTLDSSKVYGPRGFGLLYVKKNTPITAIIFGGGQESGLRSGTENIPAIRGFAKALEIANKDREVEVKRVSELRDYFIEELKKIRGDINVNGVGSPFILNVTIPKIDNEFFVLQLDAKGISCSTKSSCLGDSDDSYVLNAIGVKSKESVRFSFGRWTTKRDLQKTIEVIRKFLN